ncbi:MAG: hypothetical protein JJ979_26905 [Roseibium sp.]|nr:hypothetical protein [Roseibium sp.]
MEGKKQAIQFRGDLDEYFLNATHKMKPGGVGFSERVYAEIDQRAKRFLEEQPASVRSHAELEVSQISETYRLKANRLELEAGYAHSRETLQEGERPLNPT